MVILKSDKIVFQIKSITLLLFKIKVDNSNDNSSEKHNNINFNELNNKSITTVEIKIIRINTQHWRSSNNCTQWKKQGKKVHTVSSYLCKIPENAHSHIVTGKR